ncbi:nematode cuticle collagen domain-containing protein, partial [Aphelenchoides avenae]
MSAIDKYAVTTAAVVSIVSLLACLAILPELYRETDQLHQLVIQSVAEFKDETDLAWEELMLLQKPHLEPIRAVQETTAADLLHASIRPKRQMNSGNTDMLAQQDQCNCGIIPTCPPGPPGPPGMAGENGSKPILNESLAKGEPFSSWRIWCTRTSVEWTGHRLRRFALRCRRRRMHQVPHGPAWTA